MMSEPAMTPHRLNPVVRHVRSLSGSPADDRPDAALLADFVGTGDEAVFTVLVRRHGPMVFGLCHRLLADHHAAEDAFQATFLLLAKKARGLRHPGRLGPWLYGVARRTALKARAAVGRRREVAPVDVPAPSPADIADLRPVIDGAIARLPARYRDPVVLCYLQGLTNAEAAGRLRCPLGTVATRLSRARDRLRVLLTRQGIAPAAGALAAALTSEATAVTVPDGLLQSTARWAAALAAGSAATIPAPILTLAREVATTMLLDKLKVIAVLLALGIAGAGTGVALSRPAADPPAKHDPTRAKAETPPQPAPTGERPLPLALLRQTQPEGYRLDAGDVLGVFVEGILGEKGATPPVINLSGPAPPAVGYPTLVQEDGTILMPLVKPLKVTGRSVSEINELIMNAYVSAQIVAPGTRVLVSLARPRTYRVMVVVPSHDAPGRGARVLGLDLPAYENDVLSALAKSGMPAPGPDGAIVIQRDGGAAQVRIPMLIPADKPPFKPADVILQAGDVVVIENGLDTSTPAPAADADRPAAPVAVTMAVAAPDGRILVQMPGGSWKMIDAAKITATESDGKAVPAAALAERLKAMTAVLVAADWRKPAAAYLQLVKPGTLVLVIKD
jgi:RNA polymerase sigma factor (sigma-70 family)